MTSPAMRPRSSPAGDGVAAPQVVREWRTAAAWWLRHELGAQIEGLIRIVDVRELARNEAWVSVEAAGRHLVVGLRREPVATTGGVDDGWYQLLYLWDLAGAQDPER